MQIAETLFRKFFLNSTQYCSFQQMQELYRIKYLQKILELGIIMDWQKTIAKIIVQGI